MDLEQQLDISTDMENYLDYTLGKEAERCWDSMTEIEQLEITEYINN